MPACRAARAEGRGASRRGVAVIDDPTVVEKILRHLGVWHDPPSEPLARADPGSWTYEPFADVDHTPDYENVITD